MAARWGGAQRQEVSVANGGSLMTLVQTMERLVSVRRLADEVMKKQETLILVAVGNSTAHIQRGYLLQILEAEATGLTEMVRRLLPQKPDAAADET